MASPQTVHMRTQGPFRLDSSDAARWYRSMGGRLHGESATDGKTMNSVISTPAISPSVSAGPGRIEGTSFRQGIGERSENDFGHQRIDALEPGLVVPLVREAVGLPRHRKRKIIAGIGRYGLRSIGIRTGEAPLSVALSVEAHEGPAVGR
jgi:hypothetical protein